MCGIVGYVGEKPAGPVIFERLQRVAYRGYDSAGIASLDAEGHIELRRAEGKIERLASVLKDRPLTGRIGIGHTRWATHGRPTERNAHPHVAEEVAVVHNGIIENFAELREGLVSEGCRFSSETDTEVVPQLINFYLAENLTPLEAVQKAIVRLRGSFALAILFEGHERFLVGVRKGSPLVIGLGDEGGIIGSDPLVITGIADRFVRLEDGDIGVFDGDRSMLFDVKGRNVKRKELRITDADGSASKQGYRHFMLKEIYEQPVTARNTFETFVNTKTNVFSLPSLPFDFANVSRLSIVACGTAYHAGLVAKHWFEEFAGIPVQCDVASEFLYRRMPAVPGEAMIVISQSGETADTIAALTQMKSVGVPTLAIVNVPGNTMAEIADGAIFTSAWPEIAVASTKAFTTQLIALACLALGAARARNRFQPGEEAGLIRSLAEIPAQIASVIAREAEFAKVAERLVRARNVCYIGRGTNYPIALEGALKLKEISYVHAEAYPAGELKHGPLALIDRSVPTVVIAPRDRWFEKTTSNMQEIAARNGKIILLSDADGCCTFERHAWKSIALPKGGFFLIRSSVQLRFSSWRITPRL